MEQSTLTFSSKTMLTDKGWLTTISIDAYHMTLVAIDAIRTVFKWLTHQKIYIPIVITI
jgi:hypothetical protein